ncbi:MAG TPA: hypothetical protein VJL29_07725, partial [Thermoguttaceae bacterium]|nr:hypothetical protein [Thermoguttaceae bacterium]
MKYLRGSVTKPVFSHTFRKSRRGFFLGFAQAVRQEDCKIPCSRRPDIPVWLGWAKKTGRNACPPDLSRLCRFP